MRNGARTLLILGAGPFQLSAIRKAVALGYNVITVDYLPENVGHRMAHHSINCSTTDKEGVLRVAADLEVDGIATFPSDVAVPTVGYVNDRLGLPGISGTAATVMTMKHHFPAFLKNAGLDHPNIFIGSCFEELEEGL